MSQAMLIILLSFISLTLGSQNFVFRLDGPAFQSNTPELPGDIIPVGLQDVNLITEALAVNATASNMTVQELMNLNYLNKILYPPQDYIISRGLDNTALMAGSVAITDQYAVVSSNGRDRFTGEIYVFTKQSEFVWKPTAVITSPTDANGNFGLPLAIDNDRIIVSALAVNGYTGRVYIFTKSADSWFQTAVFISPLGRFNSFGYALDLQDNIAIIGTSTGTVFIYEYVDNDWILTQQLQSPTNDPSFGHSVSLDGEYLIVGAYEVNENAGNAFIFKRIAQGNWQLYQTFDSLGGTNSQFGYSVAICNNTVVIGAIGYRVDFYNPVGSSTQNTPGIVYVYKFDSLMGRYILAQTINSPVNTAGYFGMSIRLIQDKMIIGADGYPKGINSGAAFVFYNAHNLWTLNISMASPAGYNGHFGYSADISEHNAIIGAYGYNYLEGQVHIAPLPSMFTPTSTPTQAPAGSNNIDNKGGAASTSLPMGMIVAITLGGLVFTLVGSLCVYFCYFRVIPPLPLLDKKKKKEDEEDSPYTVHSYVGYTEMDDTSLPPPPQPTGFYFYPAPQQQPFPQPAGAAGYYGPAHMQNMKDKGDKGKEKDIHTADEGFLRRLFPYKVHSFRGYQEGMDMNEMEDEDEEGETSAMKRKMKQMNRTTNTSTNTATNQQRKSYMIQEGDENVTEDEEEVVEEEEEDAPLGPAGSRESVTVEYKHIKPVASTSSMFDGITNTNSTTTATGNNPIVQGGNRVSVNVSMLPDVDLTALRQELKPHAKKASNYVQSMYYENKKGDFNYDSPVRGQQKPATEEETAVVGAPVATGAEKERAEIKKRLMSKVSSGLSDVAPRIQDEYQDEDDEAEEDGISNVSGSQVSQGSKESVPAAGSSSHSSTGSSGSSQQVDAAKVKYAKYLAAVKNNPELAKQLTSTTTTTAATAASTSATATVHSKKENTVRTAVDTSNTTTTASTTTTTTAAVTKVTKTTSTTATATSAKNVRVTSGAPVTIPSAEHDLPIVTKRFSPLKKLSSASMDIDVAMTEPMKFMTLAEIPEEDLQQPLQQQQSQQQQVGSTGTATDLEARDDRMMRNEEVERLKSVDHVRKLVYEEAQVQQPQKQQPSTTMTPTPEEEEIRLQEEARLRTEEKARARFALFKTKAEQLDKPQK